MRCPACGHAVEPEAELCFECGEVLASPGGSPTTPSPSIAAPPSPQAQLVQRVVTAQPALSPDAQRVSSTDAHRRSPAIVWRAQPSAVPADAAPLVGPAALARPARRVVEEKVRCKGCGVQNDADAARCRGCGERMR